MSPVDALIVVAFVVYAVAVGLRNRRQASKNLEEYFLAGRSLPGWKAGLSMAATQFAADTPLLVTGLVATAGIFGLWQLWIFGVTFLVIGFVLAGAWRRAGVVTDAELTEVRYGATPAAVLRCGKALYFGTIINCVSLAWVLFAAAKIAEPFLLWNEWLPGALFGPLASFVETVGVPLTIGGLAEPEVWVKTANNLLSLGMILAVVALYSATGGLRSVVATDIGQMIVMALGTLAFTTFVVSEAGGLGAMTAKVHETFAGGGPGGILPDEILAFTPGRGKDVTFSVLSLLGLLWLINSVSDGSGYLAQRAMACRSDRDARTAAVVFTYAQVLVRSLLWLPLGVGLLVLFPPDPALAPELVQADREATYVRGMAELLPPGVAGLMLTGMLAALASTVDTHLNWGASYWTNDIYKRFLCRAWLKREPSGPRPGLGGPRRERPDPGDRHGDHDPAHVHQPGLADQPALRRRARRGAGAALDLVADERVGGDRGPWSSPPPSRRCSSSTWATTSSRCGCCWRRLLPPSRRWRRSGSRGRRIGRAWSPSIDACGPSASGARSRPSSASATTRVPGGWRGPWVRWPSARSVSSRGWWESGAGWSGARPRSGCRRRPTGSAGCW